MQGFNMGRYYPPPESTVKPSAPTKFNKSHPLGDRARKLRREGILTVRFEMPFAVWCTTCTKPTIIGQGVRFNAEKKKVGNYFSTPIWSFRMKHTACGGTIEIRTDPKATEYVVVEGGKRRDYGEERKVDDGQVLDPEEWARRRDDAMAGLEGKRDEEKVKKDSGQRIQELLRDRDRWWSDPYEANRLVRKGFRTERKERVRERDKAEVLKSRLGLDIDLMPETAVDAKVAGLVEFGAPATDGARRAQTSSLFSESRSAGTVNRHHVATTSTARQAGMQKRLQDSKRRAADPFMLPKAPLRKTSHAILSKKHDRATEKAETPMTPVLTSLVGYDSD